MMGKLTSILGRLPLLQSYRGRYLMLASVMALGLLTSGLVGYQYVTYVSDQQLALVQQRATATALTHDSLEQLHRLENQIYQLIINPPLIDGAQVIRSAGQVRRALQQLQHSRWLQDQIDLQQLLDQIVTDASALEQHVTRLSELRRERGHWFPAIGAIELQMLPANRAATDLIAMMLEEAETSHRSRPGWQIYESLDELQVCWLKATSELRLLIANRFGIFSSDPVSGIDGRAHNIQTYLADVYTKLGVLEDYRRNRQLAFLADTQLDALKSNIDTWARSFEVALQHISRPDWRADIQYLGQSITPLLNTTEQRLSGIRLELDVQSARNITDMTALSTQTARFTIVLTLLGIAFLIVTYFMFDRLLLAPIRQTTRALRREAEGEDVDAMLSSRVSETRDLVTAFEEMRSQVRTRESHLDHLAHHDGLTGLPNRLLFRDRLDHATALARRGKTNLAVLFLDLDRFKQINDSLGHAAGDELLQMAARRLTNLIRESDTVARLGGDEFAILTEGIKRREEITRLAEKIIAALEEPFIIEGHSFHISTSIGITLCPMDDTNSEGLLQGADAAMYEAKRSGKGQFRFFTTEMTEQATEYLNLETHLRAAVIAHGFELHYQPVTDKTGDTLHGFEALLRWEHPEEGYISPEIFIPVLDDMRQMGNVSRWILAGIHQQQQRLQSAGHGQLDIAINLTARLLHNEAFAKHLLQALRDRQPDPQRLVVEITEDTLTQDLEAAERVLNQLKELGVRIALDDFGTGQSSLNHLRRFPFDMVKIDREFVRDIPHDPNDVNLAQAIIQLSHAFGMEVVAEGVEQQGQLDMLRDMGCDYMQGFLISRPMPQADLLDFIADSHRSVDQA